MEKEVSRRTAATNVAQRSKRSAFGKVFLRPVQRCWRGSLLRTGVASFFVACLLALLSPRPACAWGTQAHQLVNARAAENLPEPLRSYLRSHKVYLVEHAVDPDLQTADDATERSHHFTDAEAYDKDPFPLLKRHFVVQGRPPSSVERQNGDSIWQIEFFSLQLTGALRRHRWDEADRAAVFLAHYAADLTQPLHNVLNYDGQLTHQAGIHSRFETELVSTLSNRWALMPPPASVLVNLRARIFREFLASYREREAVWGADRNAVQGRTYVDPNYYSIFQNLAGPLAEQRLEAAISLVSSLWYTAWVRAGKPALPVGPTASTARKDR